MEIKCTVEELKEMLNKKTPVENATGEKVNLFINGKPISRLDNPY